MKNNYMHQVVHISIANQYSAGVSWNISHVFYTFQ